MGNLVVLSLTAHECVCACKRIHYLAERNKYVCAVLYASHIIMGCRHYHWFIMFARISLCKCGVHRSGLIDRQITHTVNHIQWVRLCINGCAHPLPATLNHTLWEMILPFAHSRTRKLDGYIIALESLGNAYPHITHMSPIHPGSSTLIGKYSARVDDQFSGNCF